MLVTGLARSLNDSWRPSLRTLSLHGTASWPARTHCLACRCAQCQRFSIQSELSVLVREMRRGSFWWMWTRHTGRRAWPISGSMCCQRSATAPSRRWSPQCATYIPFLIQPQQPLNQVDAVLSLLQGNVTSNPIYNTARILNTRRRADWSVLSSKH